VNKKNVNKVSKFGAKERQILGGYDVMVNGDWIKDKRNFLIG